MLGREHSKKFSKKFIGNFYFWGITLISFNSIVQPGRSALSSRVLEEGDVTEEDEDDEDGIRFVTLESRFENKETVLNW